MTGRPRGFALITVLWIALLMGLFVAGLLDMGDRSRSEVQGARAQLEAEALIELGLSRAVWILKTGGSVSPTAAPIRDDGLVWRDTLPGGRIAVRIVRADGLIDLNSADGTVLSDLAVFLSRLAGTPDAYAEMQAALLQARGSHTSVQSIAEMTSVMGVPGGRFSSVTSLVTVTSGRQAPDVAYAPRAVLRDVVGLEENALEAVLSERRKSGPQASPAHAYAEAGATPVAPPRGPVWHISVAGRSSPGVAVARTWVVFLPLPEMRADTPYFLLESWPVYPDDALFEALNAPMPEEDRRE